MFRSEFHLLFIVLFSENILRISSEEASVPFLSWSNKDYLDGVDDFPAGHRVDRSTLSSQVIDKLYDSSEPQLIVLFYFNKLSIDDISKYSNSYTPNSDGGVLHNLKSSIEDSVSHLYLPMVSPVQPSAFASKAAHIIDFQEHSKDWTNLLQRSDIDLLQVYLKANENQVESSLREADGIISNVMKQVNELGLHYTSILTARASSKVPDFHKQEDTIVQVGRHLLADPTPTPDQDEKFNFVNFTSNSTKNPCKAFLFAAFVNITIGDAEKISLPRAYIRNTDGSTCEPQKSLTLRFSLENAAPLANFSMEMNFTVSTRKFWNIISSSVTYRVEKDDPEVTVELDFAIMDTPYNFSFHCGTQQATYTDPTDPSKSVVIDLPHFQVQPFGIFNDKFSAPNDCLGFFSEGVWMALFVTFIFLLILWFGVSMLGSLKVMDQFDDPKGKTITVNTTD